jgi:hypothetical protein
MSRIRRAYAAEVEGKTREPMEVIPWATTAGNGAIRR